MKKKKIILILLSLFTSTFLFSQKNELPEVQSLSYKTFIISIVQNTDKTFGYKIFGAGGLLSEQLYKPYSKQKVGFKLKKNAIKIAKIQLDFTVTDKEISSYTIEDLIKVGVTSDDYDELFNN